MTSERFEKNQDPDLNPDPITGAPGSHPIGTGVGAAGGGAAGAAIGAAVSGPGAPVGAVVGAVIGAVAGGLAGKGAAEAVNPTAEDLFWRSNYADRPYYEPLYTYDEDYRPAYEYGWYSRSQFGDRAFDEIEPDLARGWETRKSQSRLTWDKAKHAARDAWDRLSGNRPGTMSSGSNAAYPGVSSNMEVDTFAANCRTRYSGRSFDDVEGDLHREWDNSHRGAGASDTWDRVKDSVRRAWQRI